MNPVLHRCKSPGCRHTHTRILIHAHTHSSSAGSVACLTFRSFSPPSCFLLSHPSIKYLVENLWTEAVSVFPIWSLTLLSPTPPPTPPPPPLILPNNRFQSLTKQSAVQPLCRCMTHAVHRSHSFLLLGCWKDDSLYSQRQWKNSTALVAPPGRHRSRQPGHVPWSCIRTQGGGKKKCSNPPAALLNNVIQTNGSPTGQIHLYLNSGQSAVRTIKIKTGLSSGGVDK